MSLLQPKIRAARRDQQRARPALATDAHVRVTPAAREVKRQIGPEAWAVLEEMALLHAERPPGPELCDETVGEVAERLGLGTATVTAHLADLREQGLLTDQRYPGAEDGRNGRLRIAIAPASGITPVPGRATERSTDAEPVADPDKTRHLVDRLTAVGVSEATAKSLAADRQAERIADALDALDAVGDTVRNPAGWVVSAVREDWDLSEMLADRRESQAREEHWRRQSQERALADAEYDARQARVAAWSAAVSAALDDCFLELAIERVTAPVGAVDRRSVPVTRTQILAWAIAASEEHAVLPLCDALEHELETGSITPGSMRSDLPTPPASDGRPDDLAQRIRAALDARLDLERPDLDPPDQEREAAPRSAGRGRELERPLTPRKELS